jgi:hypothetical protein
MAHSEPFTDLSGWDDSRLPPAAFCHTGTEQSVAQGSLVQGYITTTTTTITSSTIQTDSISLAAGQY